jgi:hypothetical protein
MGQKSAVDRLPKEYRAMVISLLSEKWLTQEDIVNRVNDETGKQVLSRASINRFIKRYHREQAEIKATSSRKSLERIATVLERIVFFLENQYKKPS